MFISGMEMIIQDSTPRGNMTISTTFLCWKDPETRNYIVSQFKYVLFDAESFAERANYDPNKTDHSVTRFMPERYHEEARLLYDADRTGQMIVFPYFSFTIQRIGGGAHYPWWRDGMEESILKDTKGKTIEWDEYGIRYALMDMSNANYRSQCIDYMVSFMREHDFYRGILLDNMTEYPPYASRVPKDIRDGWTRYITTFINDLRHALSDRPNVKIFFNGLGFDNALHGTSHGVRILRESYADGGLLESFQSTVWDENRDTALSIMDKINQLGKTFLSVASYTRGVDAAINQRFNLGRFDGNSFFVEGSLMAAWNPISFRMQYSYLARFLLGIPMTVKNGADFAFSFQPGFTQYQFIPHYRIWNANVGEPIEDLGPPEFHNYEKYLPERPDSTHGQYIWNAKGYVYKRDFENCRAYVNINRSTSNCTDDTCWFPVAIEIEPGYELHNHNMGNSTPGGPYIYGKYYDSVWVAKEGRHRKFVILNRNEGIVLFKTGNPDYGTNRTNLTQQAVGRTKLLGCYPNPANPRTTIAFELFGPSHVKIELFNVLGQGIAMVADADYSVGLHTVPLDATNLSSGIYFYRFQVSDAVTQQKFLIIK
jgi:hypothetical protein